MEDCSEFEHEVIPGAPQVCVPEGCSSVSVQVLLALVAEGQWLLDMKGGGHEVGAEGRSDPASDAREPQQQKGAGVWSSSSSVPLDLAKQQVGVQTSRFRYQAGVWQALGRKKVEVTVCTMLESDVLPTQEYPKFHLDGMLLLMTTTTEFCIKMCSCTMLLEPCMTTASSQS